MENKIEVVYNHKKRRLTLIENGRMVGGYSGNIATVMARKIAMDNAKVEVKDGNVQVGV